jgi:hypothetical protein
MRHDRWIIAILEAACTMAHSFQSQKNINLFYPQFQFPTCVERKHFSSWIKLFTLDTQLLSEMSKIFLNCNSIVELKLYII